MPKTLNSVIEDARKTDRRVVIDFYADWCGPCKTLSPAIERVANDESLNVDLVTIDIDTQTDLAQAFKVTAVPTVIGVRGGEVKNKFVGAVPEPAIRKFCADL
ncbi:thioredoxin-like protein [Auricularia subglabra TFB-10046 SS5]|nr:thioredoxin-like protein [Auricularia subglabra TFB-10046 SS5]